MAVDTLFVCFAEDKDRNDGSPAKPFHMSDNLARFMDRSARRERQRTNKVAAATAQPDSSAGAEPRALEA
jgi:hypothetical protein